MSSETTSISMEASDAFSDLFILPSAHSFLEGFSLLLLFGFTAK